MAKDSDDLADSFAVDEQGGWLTRLLADEEELDTRAKWRLASWAAGSLGALVIAIMASQTSLVRRHDQVAAADLARQSQQIQRLAKESQSEATRLAAAIDTLNADRDRLYTRLGSLEQNLDSVTGSIARQPASKPAASHDKAAIASLPEIPVKEAAAQTTSAEPKTNVLPPAPSVAAPLSAPPPPKREASTVSAAPEQPNPTAALEPVSRPQTATVPTLAEPDAKRAEYLMPAPATSPSAPPAQPLMVARSILAPPDAGAGKLYGTPPATQPTPQPASPQAAAEPDAPDETAVAVPRTTFGVELGGANSVEGLRSLWRRMSKTHAELKGLQPIIMVKENASGGQLRLVAGPLNDAAAAAKLCASLGTADRACETSVFDGQRLPLASTAPPPRPPRKRPPKVTTVAPEPAPAPEAPPPPPQPKPGPLSSILGMH